MTETKHTSTPWKVSAAQYAIITDKGDNNEIRIADTYHNDEDAEFIVRACNAHEDLLVALAGWIAMAYLDGKQVEQSFIDWAKTLLKGDQRTPIEVTISALAKAGAV